MSRTNVVFGIIYCGFCGLILLIGYKTFKLAYSQDNLGGTIMGLFFLGVGFLGLLRAYSTLTKKEVKTE